MSISYCSSWIVGLYAVGAELNILIPLVNGLEQGSTICNHLSDRLESPREIEIDRAEKVVVCTCISSGQIIGGAVLAK